MSETDSAPSERRSWRFAMPVQFVPPGATAGIDGRTVVGPVLIEGTPRWERTEEGS